MIHEPTHTRTDPSSLREWQLDDLVIRLREWGTSRVHALPSAEIGEWLIGSAARCDVRLIDARGFVSREHARLVREHAAWSLVDLGSKNGLWIDNARRGSFSLTPGIEVGIGGLRLIAESERSIAVRAFVMRILGWSDGAAPHVDRALRALRDLATRRAPLVVRGGGDLVPLVRGLHRRTFGEQRPFVVSDPRRWPRRDAVDMIENIVDVPTAVRAAQGGTLCFSADRPAVTFDALRERLDQQPEPRVCLVVCAAPSDKVPDVGASSIVLPPLADRSAELDRIVDEYAADAIARLGAKRDSYTDVERARTLQRVPRTLSELETTVTRLIAIREHGGVTRAAARLGITHVALSRWLSRRR